MEMMISLCQHKKRPCEWPFSPRMTHFFWQIEGSVEKLNHLKRLPVGRQAPSISLLLVSSNDIWGTYYFIEWSCLVSAGIVWVTFKAPLETVDTVYD